MLARMTLRFDDYRNEVINTYFFLRRYPISIISTTLRLPITLFLEETHTSDDLLIDSLP